MGPHILSLKRLCLSVFLSQKAVSLEVVRNHIPGMSETAQNPQDLHDPGGKVRLALPEGVQGEAMFSECGRYRQVLTRDWTAGDQTPRAILWIGMNPSTADASVNDPTCNRELSFSQSWGYTRYLKANMLDWRATNPRDLPQDPSIACSANNLLQICGLAEEAEEIILAYGRLHKRYAGVISDVVDICRQSGKPLRCLGKNSDGSAKHPLYLAKTTARIPY